MSVCISSVIHIHHTKERGRERFLLREQVKEWKRKKESILNTERFHAYLQSSRGSDSMAGESKLTRYKDVRNVHSDLQELETNSEKK